MTPPRGVSLDEVRGVSELLSSLREAGDDDQVTVLVSWSSIWYRV
ncbi:hypothetical protein [Nonomuraea dietziae]